MQSTRHSKKRQKPLVSEEDGLFHPKTTTNSQKEHQLIEAFVELVHLGPFIFFGL